MLTCWHLFFATLMTQLLARTTKLLDGRGNVKMMPMLYYRAVVPIGVLYSLSLVCSNLPYLYLSVAFIQMLKVGFSLIPQDRHILRLPIPLTLLFPSGYRPCRGTPRLMVPQTRQTKRHGLSQYALHRLRHRHRLRGRNQVHAQRLSLPNGWHCVRSLPARPHPTLAEF